MADLPIQTATTQGRQVTYTPASATGDAFMNGGTAMLLMRNNGAAPVNVVINSPALCNQGGTHPITISVAPGTQEIAGPFRQDRFNDVSGKVTFIGDGLDVAVVQP